MTEKRKNAMKIIRYVVLLLGICSLIYGICREEHTEVFGKAVRICLECIGIG